MKTYWRIQQKINGKWHTVSKTGVGDYNLTEDEVDEKWRSWCDSQKEFENRLIKINEEVVEHDPKAI